jgi:hypothetical protein
METKIKNIIFDLKLLKRKLNMDLNIKHKTTKLLNTA